jgi:hypothetical protein
VTCRPLHLLQLLQRDIMSITWQCLLLLLLLQGIHAVSSFVVAASSSSSSKLVCCPRYSSKW